MFISLVYQAIAIACLDSKSIGSQGPRYGVIGDLAVRTESQASKPSSAIVLDTFDTFLSDSENGDLLAGTIMFNM